MSRKERQLFNMYERDIHQALQDAGFYRANIRVNRNRRRRPIITVTNSEQNVDNNYILATTISGAVGGNSSSSIRGRNLVVTLSDF